MHDTLDRATLNIPLLLRLFAWAREEAAGDEELHALVGRVEDMALAGDVLGIEQYAELVGEGETASTRRKIMRLLETAEMRYNPRTGRMRIVNPKKSRIAKQSHRKFKGRHLTMQRKTAIKRGVKKMQRTKRNRFGRPVRRARPK